MTSTFTNKFLLGTSNNNVIFFSKLKKDNNNFYLDKKYYLKYSKNQIFLTKVENLKLCLKLFQNYKKIQISLNFISKIIFLRRLKIEIFS